MADHSSNTTLKNTLLNTYIGVVNKLSGPLAESRFLQEGVLTPDEFVVAGDTLVYKCPNWQWSPAAKPALAVPYLPAAKQFLITRNVTCKPASAAEKAAAAAAKSGKGGGKAGGVDALAEQLKTVKLDGCGDNGAGDDWALPENDDAGADDEVVDVAAADDAAAAANSAAASTSNAAAAAAVAANDDDDDDDDLDDIPDMETFDATDNAALPAKPAAAAAAAAAASTTTTATESNVVRSRTYDLCLCYDKYYRVPRMFLVGYDEQRALLAPDAVFTDISADHAMKTVTVEPQPHTGIPMANIHPCKHAETMKRMLERLVVSANAKAAAAKSADATLDAGDVRVPRVDHYLFIFLKFMSAIIPRIEYDNTFEFDF